MSQVLPMSCLQDQADRSALQTLSSFRHSLLSAHSGEFPGPLGNVGFFKIWSVALVQNSIDRRQLRFLTVFKHSETFTYIQ